MAKVNRLALVGTGGKVYIDGELEAYIESIEVKVTGDFEDLECCGSFESDYAYTGFKCEGTMTIVKTDTQKVDTVLDDFVNGIMTERTIVTKLTNQNTNGTASYSIPNVVYTEVVPVEMKKGVIKETIPFKCGCPVVLSEI